MTEHPLQTNEEQLKEDMEGGGQYLTFAVSGERYAVDVVGIHEIVEVGAMTELPLAPDFIRGVVSLRGVGLPVVDLSVRLGLLKQEISKRSCILVIGSESHQTMGMLVDEVNEIMEIAPDLVQPAPEIGDQARNYFVHGMGRVGDHFIVLLDPARILSAEECLAIEHISQQQPSGP